MKLLVIILCLLSERFLIHSFAYQRFSWFGNYCLFIKKNIDRSHSPTNSWFLLGAVIIPIILIVSFIYFLLHSVIFGFIGLLLSVIIVFYCLGPQNAFYPLTESNPQITNNAIVGSYFAKVNRQLFAVIFWYVVAGPIAVLTYRLITLCRNNAPISELSYRITNILEWSPARLTVLLYLLVGNFQRGFAQFIQYLPSNPESNEQMLSQCGLLTARTDESEEVSIVIAENLVEHSVIVLLVLIAVFTLAAWL